MNEPWRLHMSQMFDGRPTVGFGDGAEIFDTVQDAERAARLVHWVIEEYSSHITARRSDLEQANRRVEEYRALASSLDEFQRTYETNSWGNSMPGNEFYAGKLMTIVNTARALLAPSPTDPPAQREE